MITDISVSLGGVFLHSLDNMILLQGVDEPAPPVTINAQNHGHYGQIITSTDYRTRDITVRFCLTSHDLSDRMRVLGLVTAWAATGGYLAVSYRSGQRLAVKCASFPTPTKSIDKWEAEYSIGFRSLVSPRWESTQLYTANMSASGSLSIDGNCVAPLMCTGTASGSVSSVQINCGGKSLQFADLGMVSGDVLAIAMADAGYQTITLTHGGTSTSVMHCRNTNSPDWLWVSPGANAITTTGGLSWVMSARARWY